MVRISSRSRLVTAASPFAVAAMLATSGTAWAQNAPTVPVVTADPQAPADAQQASANPQDANAADSSIVVTGFRAALRSATATKKRQDQIVEAVNAEDIGKLPDNSIAESIARLPAPPAHAAHGAAHI